MKISNSTVTSKQNYIEKYYCLMKKNLGEILITLKTKTFKKIYFIGGGGRLVRSFFSEKKISGSGPFIRDYRV